MSHDYPPAVAAANQHPAPLPLSAYSRLAGRLGVRRLSALLEELAGPLDCHQIVDLRPLIRQTEYGVTEVSVTAETPDGRETVEIPA